MWFIEFGMCGCGGDGEGGGDCWWSVVMAAVAGVEDNGFYYYISPAKTEEK